MWSRRLKCAKRSTKRSKVAGSTRSAPLMMPSTLPEVEAGQIVIGRLAGSQVEGEVGRRRERLRVLGQGTHPPGRPLQERHRTRQVGAKAAKDRRADTQTRPMSW